VKLFGPVIAFRQGGKIMISDLDDDDLATLDANLCFGCRRMKLAGGYCFHGVRDGPIVLLPTW
jgi:hypothetical protein